MNAPPEWSDARLALRLLGRLSDREPTPRIQTAMHALAAVLPELAPDPVAAAPNTGSPAPGNGDTNQAPAHQPTKVQENRIRRIAERRGYTFTKPRRRDPRAVDYGVFALLSPDGAVAHSSRSLAELEAFLDNDRSTR